MQNCPVSLIHVQMKSVHAMRGTFILQQRVALKRFLDGQKSLEKAILHIKGSLK